MNASQDGGRDIVVSEHLWSFFGSRNYAVWAHGARRPHKLLNAGNIQDVEINMENVTFKFKLGLMQKKTIQSPLEIIIDDNEKINVNPGDSLSVAVADGSHKMRLSICVVEGHGDQGKMGIVDTTLDVRPGLKYQVTYEYGSMSQKGSVSIKTV